MPEVTLLKPGHCDYSVVRGSQVFKFIGGVPKEVPPAIALVCEKTKDGNDHVFKITGMPEVVMNDPTLQNVDKEKSKTRKRTPKSLFEKE